MPLTGGASAMVRYLTFADAIYGFVDIGFAIDQYHIETEQDTFFPFEIHQIWQGTGLALAVANVTGLVVNRYNKVQHLDIRKLYDTYLELKRMPYSTPQGLAELYTKYRQTYDALIDADISFFPGADIDAVNLFKRNLQREVDNIEFLIRLYTDAAQSGSAYAPKLNLAFSTDGLNYNLLLNQGGEDILPIGSVTKNDLLELRPLHWYDSNNVPASITEIGILDDVAYVNIHGQQERGALSLYHDVVNGKILVRITTLTLLEEFPDLTPIYNVFVEKGWDFYGIVNHDLAAQLVFALELVFELALAKVPQSSQSSRRSYAPLSLWDRH